MESNVKTQNTPDQVHESAKLQRFGNPLAPNPGLVSFLIMLRYLIPAAEAWELLRQNQEGHPDFPESPYHAALHGKFS